MRHPKRIYRSEITETAYGARLRGFCRDNEGRFAEPIDRFLVYGSTNRHRELLELQLGIHPTQLKEKLLNKDE